MCSTTILDLPTEIFESVILPYLRDEDILNFGRIGIKRFEDIANGYLKDNKSFHILVVTPKQLPHEHSWTWNRAYEGRIMDDRRLLPKRPDAKSEIIHISKRRTIWSSSTNNVANLAVLMKFKGVGELGSVLNDTMIVGSYNSVYQYEEKRSYTDKMYCWKDYTRRFDMGNTFLMEGYKTEFPPLKPWLTKLFDKAYRESEKHNASEKDVYVKCNLSKCSGDDSDFESEKLITGVSSHDLSNHDNHKRKRPFWKKIVKNIMGFAIPSPSIDVTKQMKPSSSLPRNHWICQKPSVWTLSNENNEKCRYFLFKMRDHVYFAGGYISPDNGERYKCLNFDKYSLKQHQWVTCEHSLTHPLDYASVVVTPDEKCAIFTGAQKHLKRKSKPGNRIIIFEEDNGFTLVENKMLRIRFNHVSMILPVK